MTETVLMCSPDGEVREVEAVPEVLTPLVVRGWKQIEPLEEKDYASEYS